MLKENLLEFYILLFEKIFNTNNIKIISKYWNMIRTNNTLLEYAITLNKNGFKSKIIAYMILNDTNLYNTDIYAKLINKIYSSETLAKDKIKSPSTETFLMLTLKNNNLELNKKQKQFLIFEAEKSPYTEKYYKEKKFNETSIHGIGLTDIRYKILQNSNFSIQEKSNLFSFFYPDNDIKIHVLNLLEWDIAITLGLADKKDYDDIYVLTNEEIKQLVEDKDIQTKVIDNVNLCKCIRDIIPENEIIKYKNND